MSNRVTDAGLVTDADLVVTSVATARLEMTGREDRSAGRWLLAQAHSDTRHRHCEKPAWFAATGLDTDSLALARLDRRAVATA